MDETKKLNIYLCCKIMSIIIEVMLKEALIQLFKILIN